VATKWQSNAVTDATAAAKRAMSFSLTAHGVAKGYRTVTWAGMPQPAAGSRRSRVLAHDWLRGSDRHDDRSFRRRRDVWRGVEVGHPTDAIDPPQDSPRT